MHDDRATGAYDPGTESSTDAHPTDQLLADGGRDIAADLTAFQRDLLWAIAGHDGDPLEPHGLALKDALEPHYRDAIIHSRLYQNLDALADRGLVEKGEIDRRTNSYTLTDRGWRLLRSRLAWQRAQSPETAVEADDDGATARAETHAVGDELPDDEIEDAGEEPAADTADEAATLPADLDATAVHDAIDECATVGGVALALDVDTATARTAVYNLGRYDELSDVTGEQRDHAGASPAGTGGGD